MHWNIAIPGYLMTLLYNQEPARKRQLYIYVLLGLSKGSPDSGAGANLSFKL